MHNTIFSNTMCPATVNLEMKKDTEINLSPAWSLEVTKDADEGVVIVIRRFINLLESLHQMKMKPETYGSTNIVL